MDGLEGGGQARRCTPFQSGRIDATGVITNHLLHHLPRLGIGALLSATDRSADWDGASELWKRIEWADALGQRAGPHRDARELAGELLGANLSALTREALARAASASQALALLLVSPEFIRR